MDTRVTRIAGLCCLLATGPLACSRNLPSTSSDWADTTLEPDAVAADTAILDGGTVEHANSASEPDAVATDAAVLDGGTGGATALGCSDGSEPRPLYVDADADGYGSLQQIGSSCSAEAPEGTSFYSSLHGDCDDADPDVRRWTNFYRDADGDGYGVPLQGGTFDCAERPLEGMAPNAKDCDDTDPTVQLALFVDADGDTYGAEGEQFCVAADAEGHSTNAQDCDDGDPRIHVRSEFEVPLDGVDSDCNGHDFAIARCQPLPDVAQEVSVNEDCVGAVDLAIVAFSGCNVCGASSVELVVANFGTVTTGVLVHVVRGETPGRPAEETSVLELEQPLGAGAVSEPFGGVAPIPEILVEVVSADGLPDCNPANNSAGIQVGYVDCF